MGPPCFNRWPSIWTDVKSRWVAGPSRSHSCAALTTDGAADMSYKAIYTYAWDLAEIGVGAAINECHSLGLDTVTIAGTYHAGKFLRPHGKSGKVYFPEDGTAYFQTDPVHYGTIKPLPNTL